MITTESSKLNPEGSKNKIRCILRGIPVEATPEEKVRQDLLGRMAGPLGFPLKLIAVEKGLRQMPHIKLEDQEVPERRADIICFGKGIHPEFELYPLLLIECKAVKLSSRVINQVTGYNHFLKSSFIAVANQDEIKTGWYDASSNEYQFVPFLPPYQDLMQAALSA